MKLGSLKISIAYFADQFYIFDSCGLFCYRIEFFYFKFVLSELVEIVAEN